MLTKLLAKLQIFLTFTPWRAHYHSNYLYLSNQHSDQIHCDTKFSLCRADMTMPSAQVCGTFRSRSLQGQQVIRMHATTKPNMQAHLKWEQMRPKPGLWSWHLIPTSCRLSEQLQGRTLQLNCNDQFDTRQGTQQSRNLRQYRVGTFLATWITDLINLTLLHF